MKLSPTLMALVGAGAVFVLSPVLPFWVLRLTVGNMVGALVLMVLVLIVLQYDHVIGLAVFMAVAALFLEQRRRTVMKVQRTMTTKAEPLEIKELDTPAPDLVPGEIHPSRPEPEVDEYDFEPSEDSGKDTFEPVDETQDHKQPLETVPPQPGEVSELLQEKGLAHIN